MSEISAAPEASSRLQASGSDLSDEVAQRNRILDAVGYAATRIVAGTDWRSGVQELLSRLGEAMAVSRVTLFEAHDGPDGAPVQSCRYDWAEPGLQPLSDDPRYRSMSLADPDTGAAVEPWTLRRRRGEVVQATRSEVSGDTLQVFEEHGTFAFISVPVLVEGRYWGFIGFDDCRRERSWGPLDTEVLRTAAALIAGAIRQADAQARLAASEERYALAAQGANDGLWDWNIAGTEHFCAARLHEILDLDPQVATITPEALCLRLRPAGHPSLKEALLDRFTRADGKFEFECELLDEAGDPTGRWLVARGVLVGGGGVLRRVVGSIRDITERKRMERALAEAEGKRAQLARHFSENMIEEILGSSTNLDAVRQQSIGVLFADLFDFTATTATMAGAEVIRLLREFHGLVEEATFANGGTLDKYIGDGVMATFGTPRPGPDDAGNAVACARALVAAIVRWNTRRHLLGQPSLLIGVGLHYGEATIGNVGSERRLELTVVGHTINVASRLQALTRKLPPAIVASDALVSQVRKDGGEAVLGGFADLGWHTIRGQAEPLRLWGLSADKLTALERGSAGAAIAG